MHVLRTLSLVVLFMTCAAVALASPFGLSGEWTMNANGLTYKLVLLENGSMLDGVLKPYQQGPDIRVTGKVWPDGKVEFSADQGGILQQYNGYVFQGGQKNNAMVGLFSHGPHQFGWFAERSGQTPQPPYTPHPPYVPQPVYPSLEAQKVFSTATTSMSGNEKAHRLEVDTIFNKTPNHITTAFQGYVTLYAGQQLILSGNAAGTEKWRVNEFLFLEFRSGHAVRRFIAGGGLDKVKYDGQLVEKIGSRGSYHSPDEFDFASQLPKNMPIQVTAYALHYGPGIGSVSDVYLIVK